MAPNSRKTVHKRFNGKKLRDQALAIDRDSKHESMRFINATIREDAQMVEEREPRSRIRVDDGYDLPAREVKTREVQVGTVRGHKLSRVDNNGRVTVSSDELRKPTGMTWDAFRVLIDKFAANSKPESKIFRRWDKAKTKDDFLQDLREILEEYLHFRPNFVYCGKAGQRQRKVFLTRLSYRLAAMSVADRVCFVVPDVPDRIAVVFPWRTAYVSWGCNILREWACVFEPEAKACVDDYQVLRLPRKAPVAEPLGYSTEGFTAEVADFLGDCGEQFGPALMDALREWGPTMVSVAIDLFALASIKSERRVPILVAKLGSLAYFNAGKLQSRLTEVVTYLLSCPAIRKFFGSMQFGISPPDPPTVIPMSFGASFETFIEYLGKVREQVAPGTVVSAICAIVAAMWSLRNMESVTTEVMPAIFACARGALNVPETSTPLAIVKVLVSSVPLVIAAVSTAITARSLAPLLAKRDSLFEEYVKVKTASELHSTGQYPNHFFASSKEYVDAVLSLEDKFKAAVAGSRPAKEVMQYRLQVSTLYQQALHSLRGQFRRAPYCFCLEGGSGLGKSSLVSYGMDRAYSAMFDKQLQPQDIYVHNAKTKHADGLSNSTEAVLLDDVGSAKIVQGVPGINPTDLFIDLVNNVPTASVQADIIDKGRIFWRMSVVAATTNVPGFNSHLYQSCPVAVLRRVNLYIEVEVKPQYRKHGSTLLDDTLVPPPSEVPIPDLWNLKLYRVLAVEKEKSDLGYIKQYINGSDDKPMDVYDMLDFLQKDAKEHAAKQRRLEETLKEKSHRGKSIEELRLAAQEYSRSMHGESETKVETLGFMLPAGLSAPLNIKLGWPWQRTPPSPSFSAKAHIGGGLFAVGSAVAAARGRTGLALGAGLVSAGFITAGIVSRRIHKAAAAAAAFATKGFVAISAFVAWLIYRRRKLVPSTPLGAVEFSMQGVEIVPPHLSDKACSTTLDGLSVIVERASRFYSIEDGPVRTIGVILAVCTGLYVVNLHTIKPVLERLRVNHLTIKITSNTDHQSSNHIVSFSDIWIPDADTEDLCFIRINGRSEPDLRDYFMPAQWPIRAREARAIPVEESRLCILRAPLPVKTLAQTAANKLTRHRYHTHGPLTNISVSFEGNTKVMLSSGFLERPVSGDCGSPFIASVGLSGGRGVMIAGILSGVTNLGNNSRLVYATITHEMTLEATRKLIIAEPSTALGFEKLPGMADNKTLVDRPHAYLDKDIPGVEFIGTLVENSGSSSGMNLSSLCTFSTNLSPSGLDDVEFDRIVGPLKHKLPERQRDATQFRSALLRLSRESDLDLSCLDSAEADLLTQWVSYLTELGPNERPRPASLFEGINGTSCMKPLPLNTAAGFGFSGVKSKHMVVACTTKVACSDPGCDKFHPANTDYMAPGRANFYPGPPLLAAFESLRARVADDPEFCAIFVSALKDEAIGIDKTRMRVFFGGSTPFNLLVRMYISPLFVALAQDSRISENCVGMDVMSADWGELMADLESYSQSGWLGGDYSNYDNSIVLALVQALGRILVACARASGYSDEQVCMVRSLLKALERPVYVFLGTVYRASGSNPSGVAITTYMNSGYNSLIHRMAFYRANPQCVPIADVLDKNRCTPFRANVCLRTYGDDVIGSPRNVDGVQRLTNYHVRDVAASLGMKYGAATKGQELPELYAPSELRFLKCADVYSPSLERRVGSVELSSVRKALAFERSKARDARINTASAALRLFYAHCDASNQKERYDTLRNILHLKLTPQFSSVTVEDILPSFDEMTASIRDPSREKVAVGVWTVEE